MKRIRCRLCEAELAETFADLGMSPLSNSFVAKERRHKAETFFPLHAYVCTSCWLVQLEEFESPKNIFNEYLYFSSYADSWLKHCEAYCAHVVSRFKLDAGSQVVEIASNDGALLKNFVARGIPSLGVEPAANVAKAAVEQGVPTEVAFFGTETSLSLKQRGFSADLIAANNVLAHVPDIVDFVAGCASLLKPDGVVTFEFPSLERLIAETQFDTIYHEHFSYLSLLSVERLFGLHGLRVFDVQTLPTHGGSLRIFACRKSAAHALCDSVAAQRHLEAAAALGQIDAYRKFARTVVDAKIDILRFFIDAHQSRKRVVGYGAPAKANTLLNFCGIGTELLEFTVDRNPHKQGMLMPGSRVPVLSPDEIFKARPDYVMILPWNLQAEISESMKDIRAWGGKFVVPIPKVRILP
ncbi:MAG: class I SAM-dependent methyltransferase [Afipia sp.]|nr:class I SAM-dependent methyltransferase [Afipia sp.]